MLILVLLYNKSRLPLDHSQQTLVFRMYVIAKCAIAPKIEKMTV